MATGRALPRAGCEMSFAGDGDEALLMAFALLTESDLALEQGADPLLDALQTIYIQVHPRIGIRTTEEPFFQEQP